MTDDARFSSGARHPEPLEGRPGFADQGEPARRLACAIAFTDAGDELCERLREALSSLGWQTEVACGHGPGRVPLENWTQDAFGRADALVFVGALGIAVRAIAPFLRDKTQDPAVLVIDEAGRWVIPALSGHIGGANALGRQIAERIGAEPVVTTASDVRGVWSPDGWASACGAIVGNPSAVKAVSSRLLAGKTIALSCDFPLAGALPSGVAVQDGDDGRDARKSRSDVHIGWKRVDDASCVQLVIPSVRVGVGCRRGVSEQAVEQAVDRALELVRADPRAVESLHTIDLKAEEPALLALCRHRGWRFVVHDADRLRAVSGSVSPSAFVESVTGVDNVCERAALADGGALLLPKSAHDGVTVALALSDVTVCLTEEGR